MMPKSSGPPKIYDSDAPLYWPPRKDTTMIGLLAALVLVWGLGIYFAIGG